MGAKGQNTKSIRKKPLGNSKKTAVGVKSLRFYHEAGEGESYIDITSLTLPSGVTNPSPAEALNARMKDFSENLILTSSLRPMWIEGLSYEVVSNTSIKLKSSYEALEGEIFTLLFFNHATSGVVIGDVRTPNGSGDLLEGVQEYNLGEAIPIEDLTSQWPIQVFRDDGSPMLRNTGNAEYTGDDTIGNYQMIDRGDGFCQVIKFNIPGEVGGEPVAWATHGALGERPSLSVLQHVDKINGVLDIMREDLLKLSGNDIDDPTRYDGGVPTQSDLQAFGNLVNEVRSLYDVSTKVSEYTKVKTATKVLSANLMGTGVMTDLTFNNLVAGKWYRITGQINVTGDNGVVNFKSRETRILIGTTQVWYGRMSTEDTGNCMDIAPVNVVVQAPESGSLTVDSYTDFNTYVNSINGGTYITLEELPNHEATNEWD